MIQLPRIAVGTVQRDADVQFMTWALMNVLERSGLHVQSFSSQSRFLPRDAALSITGKNRRYLDSWLMPSEVCAELFVRGTRCSDIGLVEGHYDVARKHAGMGGSLDTLCEWLDLPRIVTLDASRLNPCHLLPLPRDVDGLLLDNISDTGQLCSLQTELEAMTGAPVLGAIERLEQLRMVSGDALAKGQPTAELCHALGDALAPHLRLEKLLEVAGQRDFKDVKDVLFHRRSLARPLHVAIAFDDAFSCYFPNTLDVLAAQGASVSVFSPLHSERLPENTDLVYFGCGRPDDYLNELAAHFCMKESLWKHVASGKRIYAESAGLAYLGHEIVMPCGHHYPMVGLIPVQARLNPTPPADRPVEVTMNKDSWLFDQDDRVRGYLNPRWIVHPDGILMPLVSEAEHSHDIVGSHQIVGSRLHLNFAASQQTLGKFFRPSGRSPLDRVY